MTRPEPLSPVPMPPVDGDPAVGSSSRVTELLETYLAQAQQRLRRGSGRSRFVKQARAFLRQRGAAGGPWERLPLGVLPEAAEMETALREAGFLDEELEASRLLADPRLPGRLIGPIRTVEGQLVSFWARHPGGKPPRYLIKGAWREELAVAGLDVAGPGQAEDEGGLLVISDLLDAVLLQYQGVRSAVALAGPGTQMTARRWERLAELGISQVTLAFLGMNVRDELLAALEAAWSAECAPQISVVLPERFQEVTTWSEWVRLHGVEAFREALQAARIHAYRFCASVLLESHRGAEAWTEATRQAALAAAHVFYEAHAGGLRTQELDAQFVPCIVAALQCPWEAPRQPLEPQQVEPLPEAIGETQLAQEASDAPIPGIPVLELEPLRSLAVEMADWAGPEGLYRCRLRQRTLPALDRATAGLRGVVLLAGPTRMARSALALQLAAEIVRHHRDACLLVVSRRWSSAEILTRLLARRASIAWKRLQRGVAALSEPALRRLDRAQAELSDWGRRVLVLDRTSCAAPTLDCAVDAWTRLKSDTKSAWGLVVIDDLSSWGVANGISGACHPPCELLRSLADRTRAEAVLATVGAESDALSDEADLSLTLRFSPARAPRGRGVLSKLLVSEAQELTALADLDLTFYPQSWRFHEGHPDISNVETPAVETWHARRQATDYCQFHRCPAMDCFCFD